MRTRVDLFLVSLLVLFLELACIRWFPAHVLFLTFFTNTVLLACFLGMSVGCLAADRRKELPAWTPPLLASGARRRAPVRVGAQRTGSAIDVGNLFRRSWSSSAPSIQARILRSS